MTKHLLLLWCVLLSCSFQLMGQKSVTGKIKDETGQTLPGVSVLLKGSTTGTVSGADGVVQAKQQFFTSISHELRTPISLIIPPIQQIINRFC